LNRERNSVSQILLINQLLCQSPNEYVANTYWFCHTLAEYTLTLTTLFPLHPHRSITVQG